MGCNCSKVCPIPQCPGNIQIGTADPNTVYLVQFFETLNERIKQVAVTSDDTGLITVPVEDDLMQFFSKTFTYEISVLTSNANQCTGVSFVINEIEVTCVELRFVSGSIDTAILKPESTTPDMQDCAWLTELPEADSSALTDEVPIFHDGCKKTTLQKVLDLFAEFLVTAPVLAAALALKVDKVAGKQLSTNDYTNAEKSKLAALTEHFKGVFTSLAALQIAFPTANAGDYASVDPGPGQNAVQYIWDVDSAAWVISGGPGQVVTVNGQTGAVVLTTDNIGEGATNQYFTAARVRASVLTGLSLASSAAITAADTVLSAFGKLQAQISLRANKKLTVTSHNAGFTMAETDDQTLHLMTSASANSVTLPSLTTAPTMTAGWQTLVKQKGAGQVTFIADGGTVTIESDNGFKTRAQFSIVTIICESTSPLVYTIAGGLTT